MKDAVWILRILRIRLQTDSNALSIDLCINLVTD